MENGNRIASASFLSIALLLLAGTSVLNAEIIAPGTTGCYNPCGGDGVWASCPSPSYNGCARHCGDCNGGLICNIQNSGYPTCGQGWQHQPGCFNRFYDGGTRCDSPPCNSDAFTCTAGICEGCKWGTGSLPGNCDRSLGEVCTYDFNLGSQTPCCIGETAPFCDYSVNSTGIFVCHACFSAGSGLAVNPYWPYHYAIHTCPEAPCCGDSVCCASTDPSVCDQSYINNCRACGNSTNGLGCVNNGYCCPGFSCNAGTKQCEPNNQPPYQPATPAIAPSPVITPTSLISCTSCLVPADPDAGDTVSLQYRWERKREGANNNQFAFVLNWPGASTYQCSNSSCLQGDQFRLLIRGVDNHGMPGPASNASNIVTVAGVPPQPSISPSPVAKGNSVYCSANCPSGLEYAWRKNNGQPTDWVTVPGTYSTSTSNIGDNITLQSRNATTGQYSSYSNPSMVISPGCIDEPGAVCPVGAATCCANMKCIMLRGTNQSGSCCIKDNNINCKIGGALNNSACCNGKCEPNDAEGGTCVSCWSTAGKDCGSAADCCSSGPFPICALPVGATTQKQCLNCIPTGSLSNCTGSSTSNNRCCGGLCNLVLNSTNYSKCVSCLPVGNLCSNDSQCCSNLPLYNGKCVQDDSTSKHCALVPICGQTNALCLNDSDCCSSPNALFCDRLNQVGIPIDPIIGTGSGTQGDSWGGGMEGGEMQGDGMGGSVYSYGSCKTCFGTNTKCDDIHSCCDAAANCTLPPSGGSTKYCLLPPATPSTYLFNSWVKIGSGSFTPDADAHSGSTAAKIEYGAADSFIYNSALQGVLLGNRKYSLEFWAKSAGEGDVYAKYAIYDASNNVYLNSAGAWENAPDDGEPITFSKLLTGSYARKVQDFSTLGGASIQLRFYTPASGVYYLDDVSVTEINDFTMSAWVKAGAEQVNAASLFRQIGQEFGNNQGIDWFLSSGNLLTMGFYSTGEGGISSRVPQLDLSDGNWHHVAFSATRTGSYYAYLDGVLKSSGAFGLGRMNSSSPFLIGASDELGSNGFKGQIDEVRFYKRALSSQEVLNHFRGMYQDKCSMDLTVVYNRSTATGSISTAYNANLRLKRQLPESVLSLPFDIYVSSDAQGAITDYSRLLQHSTKTGAAWTSSGRIGGAYQFNTATDKITVPSTLLSGSGDFTLSAWVLPKTLSGTERIMGNKLADDSDGVSLYLSGSIPTLAVGGSSISSSAIAPETWAHVAATRNNGVGRLYINGAEAASGSVTGPLASTGNFAIGNSPSSSQPFSGTIDEVNVFTRALSAGEIASLYNESVSVSSRPLITSQN